MLYLYRMLKSAYITCLVNISIFSFININSVHTTFYCIYTYLAFRSFWAVIACNIGLGCKSSQCKRICILTSIQHLKISHTDYRIHDRNYIFRIMWFFVLSVALLLHAFLIVHSSHTAHHFKVMFVLVCRLKWSKQKNLRHELNGICEL